jgi:hypothetical protein
MLGAVPDAKPRSGLHAGPMSERRQLIIELDAGADPVQGSIGPSDGATEPFSGYVQLIAALEGYRALDGYGGAYRGTGGYRGEREDRTGEAAPGRGANGGITGRGIGARETATPPGSGVAS